MRLVITTVIGLVMRLVIGLVITSVIGLVMRLVMRLVIGLFNRWEDPVAVVIVLP